MLSVPGPESVQVTPAFAESLLTVAVMVWVCPWLIVGVVLGESVIPMPDFPEQPTKVAAHTNANANR